MKRITLVLFSCAFMFFSSFAFAQSRTVTGKVTGSDDGLPLPGVNILIKGTTSGVATNNDGTYSIQVNDGATLVFRYLGYVTQELPVGNQTIINVSLAPDAVSLGEVVVVGYGTQLKQEFTGSAVSVGSETLETLPVLSANQALQGQASGVFVTSSSGQPGGGIAVRVRGVSSINASTEPLYVIDGVPVIAGNLQISGFGGQGENALAGLNPQDIASIEVLKDAASTAIYGARAANGVVLITTKRGSAGDTRINFNAWTGWASATNTGDVQTLNAADWRAIVLEGWQNDIDQGFLDPDGTFLGASTGLPSSVIRAQNDGNLNDPVGTNWLDEVLRTARISEYQLSAQGGNEKTSFYVSASYRDEEGIIEGSGSERMTARLNLDNQATDKLKVGVSLSVGNTLNSRIQNDNNIFGVLSSAILTPSIYPIRNAEGEFVDALPFFGTNALRVATQPRQENRTLKAVLNSYINYNIMEGLDFRADFSYDYNELIEDQYRPSTTTIGRGTQGQARYGNRQIGTVNIEPTLRYTGKIGTDHSITAVAGATYQDRTSFVHRLVGETFANDNLNYIGSAAQLNLGLAAGNFVQYTFNSLFGRVNYAYKGKYIVSGSYRRDGSSRFGPGNRFGNFWSVSGAWNFAEESFMSGFEWLNLGKLRASYGVTGNDGIGNFEFLGTFTAAGNYLDQPAFLQQNIENSNLQWEESKTFDVGLELSMFNNRVNLNLGYFKSTTDALLLERPLPQTTGFAIVQDNVGEIENSGIEIDLNTTNIDAGGFLWSTNFNISFLENEVISLATEEPIRDGFASIIQPGSPINTFFGLKYLGPDPQTGRTTYEDFNGDGNITAADQQIIGDHQPDFIGGMTNNFSYKGISLNVFFQFVEGVDVFNNNVQFAEHMGSSSWGMTTSVLDRWQNPGDVTNQPRAWTTGAARGLDNSDNSRALQDGSYIRLKNITLGYDLPQSLVSKLKLRSINVYVTGENIWTSTDYEGFDPEVSAFGNRNGQTSAGTDFLTFPQRKLYSLGIRVGL